MSPLVVGGVSGEALGKMVMVFIFGGLEVSGFLGSRFLDGGIGVWLVGDGGVGVVSGVLGSGDLKSCGDTRGSPSVTLL